MILSYIWGGNDKMQLCFFLFTSNDIRFKALSPSAKFVNIFKSRFSSQLLKRIFQGRQFLLLPSAQIVSCSILFVTKLKFSSEGRGEGTGLSQQSNSVFLTPSITTWELQHQSNLSFLQDQSIWGGGAPPHWQFRDKKRQNCFFFRHF